MSTADLIYETLRDRGQIQMAMRLIDQFHEQTQTGNMLIARSHQQYAQRVGLEERHGGDAGMTTIEPPMYSRDPQEPREILKSTTFGIRDRRANDWAFYVQKHGDIGRVPLLVGVAFAGGAQPTPRQSCCVIL